MYGEGQRSNDSHVVMDLRSNESHVVMVIMDERMDVCDAQGSDANYFTDAMDLCEPQSEWEAGGSDTDSLKSYTKYRRGLGKLRDWEDGTRSHLKHGVEHMPPDQTLPHLLPQRLPHLLPPRQPVTLPCNGYRGARTKELKEKASPMLCGMQLHAEQACCGS